jgi:hypothetical protein
MRHAPERLLEKTIWPALDWSATVAARNSDIDDIRATRRIFCFRGGDCQTLPASITVVANSSLVDVQCYHFQTNWQQSV